jgi:hypothetical protein
LCFRRAINWQKRSASLRYLKDFQRIKGRAHHARFNPRSYCVTARRQRLEAPTSFAVTQ